MAPSLTISEIMQAITKNALYPESPGKRTATEKREVYNDTFKNEGKRKVKFVIDNLAEMVERRQSHFDPVRSVVLSIGGSDGSDAIALMTETGIKHGILLEYSNEAGQAAVRNADANAHNYTLKVVIGDAAQKLAEALEKAREIAPDADTLITLCFGVLHELPTRSPNYLHDRMLDQLFDAFPNVLFYASEPCSQPAMPIGWPEIVEIGFPHVDPAMLHGVAQHVRDRLFQEQKLPAPEVRGPWVRMHRDLAVEVLHKTLRFDSVPSFHHEMQERLTSFEADVLLQQVARRWPGLRRNLSYYATLGFLEAYDRHQVQARDENGNALTEPLTHCRLMLHRFSVPRQDAEIDPARKEPQQPVPGAIRPGTPTAINNAGRNVNNVTVSGGGGANVSINIGG